MRRKGYKRLLLLLTVYTAAFIALHGISASSLDPTLRQEIATLFSSMGPKSTPLYLCDPEMGGVEWQSPSSINCDSRPQSNDTKKLVQVTLYWNDISTQFIKGYECTGTREELNVYQRWISASSSNPSLESVDISADECWAMVKDKVAPNKYKLNRVSDELFETDKRERVLITPTFPAWKFWASHRYEVINFRLQEVLLTVSEADGSIRTTAGTLRPCFYNESHCPTNGGTLVWRTSDVRTCRLLEGESSNCMLRQGSDGTTLSCPDLRLYMHGIDYVDMCGMRFGTSTTGIYFLQNRKGAIDHKIATPKQVRNLITSPRQKRSIDHKPTHAFEAEIKANLNFLYETIKNGSMEIVWRFETRLCEQSRSQLELITAVAESGHPSLTARFMYQNPALRAEFVGDLVVISQCFEITEYMFLERTDCSYEWPIQYIYRHEVFTGYVEPRSHTIVPEATIQPVDKRSCKKFYFMSANYTVLLAKDKAIPVNVPTLPHPGNAHNMKDLFPPVAFPPSGNLRGYTDEAHTVCTEKYR